MHHLCDAQNTQKKVADRHRRDSSTTFQVGDRVWLLQGRIKTTRPCCKLDYQRFGPYVISGKINDVAFRLDPPPLIEVSDGSEYEVAAILDSKIVRNKLYYLVDWLGYTPNDRTWEPLENLANASEMVAAFHNKYPHKPSPKSCLPTRGTRRRKGGIMS